MAELFSPVAIGLISDPPTIVVSYDCISRDGEKRKRRKRKMPLRDFTDRSNVKRYAFNLRQRHTKYLADIIDVTLEKMLRIVQEIQRGNSVERATDIVNKEYSIDGNEDLNKLSPAQLAQRKAVMEETYHKNLLKPGDLGFVYDKEVQFEVKSEKCSDGNDWDEESEILKNSKVHHVHSSKLSNDEEEEDDNNMITESANKIQSDKDIISTSPVVSQLPPAKTLNADNDTGAEIFEEEISITKVVEDDLNHIFPSPKSLTISPSNNVQIKQSSLPLITPLENVLTRDAGGGTIPKSDDGSSSSNIEEAVVNIESGLLEDEDEDFWQ